ncbi:MAG: hypothetical protein JW953_01845 [Anaerolineae bacterium]|nr:hypothetical protein [Anaerolineae bacterium]
MPSPSHIPTYLPLDQAAQHYGLPQKVLTQQIQAGKIPGSSIAFRRPACGCRK